MFKVIAIQTLSTPIEDYRVRLLTAQEKKFEIELRRARHDSVMKVLHPETGFWLERGYDFINGKVICNGDILPEKFFSNGVPYVTVSAIVGENGMGKSSLLELLYRLINNTSYALKAGLDAQKNSLHFVRDIYARLWFQADNGILYIEQTDSRIKICNQNEDRPVCVYDYANSQENKITSLEAKEMLKGLFYTIVVNYSQYALNTNDYLPEWDEPSAKVESAENQCWLSSLFHKNDAYQTPIVLNPFRENGNININRERDLTQTRLYHLVLNEASPLSRILRRKDAKAFIFDIDNDLNPIPGKRYYSNKVVTQMMQMQLLKTRIGDYKSVNDIGRRITAAWGHALGYEIESRNGNGYWENMDDVRTINYIVYKTLKISRTYVRYQKYHDCFQNTKQVQAYVAELNRDDSHIMLKIRRCLAFLFFHHYGTGTVVNGNIVGNTQTTAEFNERINKCLRESEERYSELTKEQYTTYYYGKVLEPHIWMPEELMPAPSFKTDILLEGDDGDIVRFSSLSSGEKQMIYSISTVLYQLRNIDSVWDTPDQDNITYKSVCLIFDEIELYAHPKYQLMLINLLVESIQSLMLLHIRNVQIILATHSPFVLSDIPSSNILCLKDGKPVTKELEIDSFCANVYDILNNQFFMDRFTGDFANEKLNDLITTVNKENKSRDELERLKKEVGRVGDKYIRQLLFTKLTKEDD